MDCEVFSAGDAPLPPVTVVIPTHNRRQSLERCLRAIFRSEGVAGPLEIRVVDDASEDGTDAVVTELAAAAPDHVRLHCHRQPRGGPSSARNLGVEHATGEVILFTDDDCEPEPRWAPALQAGFRDPRTGGISGRIRSAHEGNWVSHYCRLVRYNEFPQEPGSVPTIRFTNTANCAYRRSALLDVGGFDQLFSRVGYEDVDLSRRVLLRGYRLEYQAAAVVLHHHREDPESLYAAFRKRGYASVLLDTAWNDAEPPERMDAFRAALTLLRQRLRVALIPLDARNYLAEAQSAATALRFAWLSWLTDVARAEGEAQMTSRLLRGEQTLERSTAVPERSEMRRALREARRMQREWFREQGADGPEEASNPQEHSAEAAV